MTDTEIPRGHICPNDKELNPGIDDLCDLPEEFKRLSYVLSIDARHDCGEAFGHGSRFCKHAVFQQVCNLYRGKIGTGRSEGPSDKQVLDHILHGVHNHEVDGLINRLYSN